MTNGNDNYIAILENALCGLSKVQVTNVVIFALDAKAFVHFRSRGLAVSLVFDPSHTPAMSSWPSTSKIAQHYPYSFHKRPEITAAVLRLGYNVLFAGNDVAFIFNPFEAILSTAPVSDSEHYASDSYYVNMKLPVMRQLMSTSKTIVVVPTLQAY